MKKLVLLVVVAVGVWLGVNYVKTGKVSLLPVELSAEEQELRDLEAELKSIDQQIAQESRAAGVSGVDSTTSVSRLMERRQKVEERLTQLRRQLAR